MTSAEIIDHSNSPQMRNETYLDSTTPTKDNKLQIPGYTLIRSDQPLIQNTGESVYIIEFFYP